MSYEQEGAILMDYSLFTWYGITAIITGLASLRYKTLKETIEVALFTFGTATLMIGIIAKFFGGI
ncbi:MAG: hypothetical protein IMZ52_04425 [Actinobacteria bacterium]|nr:hypothetical protein [Actinomycetota bacterium]MBE3122035.1 hypothetical protein [Thermoplasmata archaeon]